jgi:hypothetical protein
MVSQWLWMMVCYAESVVVNYAVLCLWIMVSYIEPVTVNHGLLCYASGCESWWVMLCQVCESWCVMLSMWWWIMLCYTAPCGCESWCAMLSQWLWIMVCYTDPVVVNHVCYTEPNSCESCCFILSRLCLSYGVSCPAVGYEWYESVVVNYGAFCWTSGLESWCGMLSQWLWIMVCYTDPVDVNHVCYTEPNSCESCCFILSQLCLSYGVSCRAAGYEWYESVVVNYGAFCWTSGPESWCVMLSKWLWLMVCNAEQVVVSLHTMTHNHWLSITHHDSQPLAQHYTPWLTTTDSA